MAILAKGCKPDNFESHNSVKLSFTSIRGLHSNFVECEYFLESNSADIHALCEKNLDDSIDSGNFSMTAYLPLVQEDSVADMSGLAAYVKEGLLCWTSLENSVDSFLCFQQGLLHSVSYFFFSIDHLCLYTFFHVISSNIDKVFSINPSVDVFFFHGRLQRPS